MQFLLPPLDFTDVSVALAAGALILLVTAELFPSYFEPNGFLVNKKRLQNAAVAAGILFLATVAYKIISIVLSV
jgi:zinc transporter ZupT